jgi:epoxide hydrolase 4
MKESVMGSETESIFLNVNGIRLHTLQAGPKDGPLLVLLHGFPEFSYGWRHQIDFFAAKGWRVVAPDQRGYNLSDKPKGVGSYAIGEMVEDTVGLIDVYGREKAWLVGHDWGAAVAWETALRHPERLEKLAILNVPHPDVMMRTLRGSPAQMLKSWYIFFFQIPGLPEWSLGRRRGEGMARMLKGSGKPTTFSADELERYREAWSQPGALTAMINWYRAVFRGSLKGQANVERRVKVPTLVLWGKQDVALSVEMAPASLALCDNGRLVTFENATHWVQHDEAEAVNRELEGFLRQGK